MFDLSQYETVDSRIAKFYEQFKNGRIITELVAYSDNQFIVKAYAYRDSVDEKPAATGFAEEKVGSNPVNRTSALENCETSAIGRCLANLNFAPKGARPSVEEMQKASRQDPNSKPLIVAGGPMARAKATDKQVGFAKSMIQEIASRLEFSVEDVTRWACENYSVATIEDLSMKQISHFIADVSNMKKQGESSEFYMFVRSKKGPDFDPWATPTTKEVI